MDSRTSPASGMFSSSQTQHHPSYDYTIAIAGNPNVGKSTIFNQLTGMHQHTGNWPGKTVANAVGFTNYRNQKFRFVDIPGTYSLMSHSEEEEIARDYICFSKPDLTVVILDATCLERSLNLVYQIMEITPHLLVCVNLLDEAKKKGIEIDLDRLSAILGVPVVGTIARKKKTIDSLLDAILKACHNRESLSPRPLLYPSFLESCIHTLESPLQQILTKSHSYLSRWVSLKLLDGDPILQKKIQENLFSDQSESFLTSHLQSYLKLCDSILEEHHQNRQNLKDLLSECFIHQAEIVCQQVLIQRKKANRLEEKLDRILTSKCFGIPIMIAFLGCILWLTIIGANYPSQLLSQFFGKGQELFQNCLIDFSCPDWLLSLLVDGIYGTVTWIVSVMLPPMAIFFPLFTLLEDFGFLPRIAFNLDHLFCKAGSSRETIPYDVYGIWLQCSRNYWLSYY